MDANLTPTAEFMRTVAKLRGAAPHIKKTLSAEVKSATEPIERAAKANILSVESRGARGGGGAQRGTANASRSKLGKSGNTSLRAGIAKGVTRKIDYTGFRTGVRVRVDGKYLPPSQRALIKAINKGKVRHPVFGNPNNWTTQEFTPEGWFDRAAREHGPAAIRKIQNAARKALRDLEK